MCFSCVVKQNKIKQKKKGNVVGHGKPLRNFTTGRNLSAFALLISLFLSKDVRFGVSGSRQLYTKLLKFW